MSATAGRRRRRSRSEGLGRIGVDHRSGGLVRWQADARRGVGGRLGLWSLVVVASGLLALALIAAQTAGWLRWSSLLMLVPAAVLLGALGAGLLALLRRGLAWLAG
jgi:hypothetical protein